MCPKSNRQSSVKTVAIIGVGARGTYYGDLIAGYPHLGKVAAVVEPRKEYREGFAKVHGIPNDRQFADWHKFAAQPKICDAVVVATIDREHVGPAVACLKAGYDLLLEKPMATTLADCRAIEKAQRDNKAVVGVCHSLRYQKGFRRLVELVREGVIGRVITMDQIEQVRPWHQAHSYVRGNWGNEGRATFMLLAKSCHDIDYMAYLIGKPCLRVSSFGALTHFRADQAPSGSTARCTGGCAVEPQCPYSAIKQYVQGDRETWPGNMVSYDHSQAAHLKAIRSSPYGRCVYQCDNDVVDHQVVNMEFEGDITATFTMTAFTADGGRRIRVHGTEGVLEFNEFGEAQIVLKTFRDQNVTRITIAPEIGGHGGGDSRVMYEWLQALRSRDASQIVANAQESLRTHTIVFAAEKARCEKRVVELAEMTKAE